MPDPHEKRSGAPTQHKARPCQQPGLAPIRAGTEQMKLDRDAELLARFVEGQSYNHLANLHHRTAEQIRQAVFRQARAIGVQGLYLTYSQENIRYLIRKRQSDKALKAST